MHHKTAILGALIFSGFFISSYIGSFAALVCFGVLGACAIAIYLINRKRAAVFVLTGLAAAFLIYGTYSAVFIEPALRLCGTTRTMTAKVLSVGIPDNDTVSVTAEGYADGTPLKISFYCPDIGVRAGDTIELDVKLTEPLKTANYSGDYNYSRGIFVRAYQENVTVTAEASGLNLTALLAEYSEYLRDAVRTELPGEEGALILAMCFGDKSLLGAELSDAVARSGLSHMTAVSGMHISLIVTAIISLLDTAGMKKRRIAKFTAVVLLSAVFMVFFSMTASVRRSGIMLVIYYGSLLFRRKPSPADSLGAAVMLILLAEPCACRDAGLMLSVCGTLGAVLAAPKLSSFVRARVALPFKTDLPFVCICSSYCTLPLSALIFGRISLVSVISSLAVYPMFLCTMILVLAAAFTGGLLTPALMLPAGALVKAMIAVIRFFAGMRFACIPVSGDWLVPFLILSVIFITSVVLLSFLSRRKTRAPAVSAVLCACTIAGLLTAQRVADSGVTRVRVWSDGKNGLVTVANDTGVSAFATDINRKLSSAVYEMLTDSGAVRYDLLCVLTEKKHSAVYSEAFESVSALARRYLDNSENIYDVGGNYTVEVYEDAVLADINGVKLLITDAACAPTYGGCDIAIYSRYKKAADVNINGITVLCDKRYADSPYNAYFRDIEIRIDREGNVLVKTG